MVHTEYGREHWDLGGGEHCVLTSKGSEKWSKGKGKGNGKGEGKGKGKTCRREDAGDFCGMAGNPAQEGVGQV